MSDPGAAALHVQQTIDREVDLVTTAMDLVATGGAPSTIVAGIRMTDAVMEILAPVAKQRGVVLEALWSADETSQDIRVRRGGAQ